MRQKEKNANEWNSGKAAKFSTNSSEGKTGLRRLYDNAIM